MKRQELFQLFHYDKDNFWIVKKISFCINIDFTKNKHTMKFTQIGLEKIFDNLNTTKHLVRLYAHFIRQGFTLNDLYSALGRLSDKSINYLKNKDLKPELAKNQDYVKTLLRGADFIDKKVNANIKIEETKKMSEKEIKNKLILDDVKNEIDVVLCNYKMPVLLRDRNYLIQI